MSAASLAPWLLSSCLGLVNAVPQDSAALEAGRLALQRGQLAQAAQHLAPLAGGPPSVETVRAQLLLGNVAYERDLPEAAQQHYQRALDLLRELQTGPAEAPVSQVDQLTEALTGNLKLAGNLSSRQAELTQAASRLRLAVGAFALVVLITGLWLLRRSAADQRMSSTSSMAGTPAR
ncbi:MAG: hypothetical protein ACT4PU_02170 [Planctomycetota bacterium]